MMKRLRNLTIAIMAAATIVGCKEYVPVETFAEPDDPVALTAEQQAAWEGVSGKLNAAWGCPDSQYARSIVPEKVSSAMRVIIREPNGTTTIEEAVIDVLQDNVVYDLQGRRVANPIKGGVYIVNGKKVVKK